MSLESIEEVLGDALLRDGSPDFTAQIDFDDQIQSTLRPLNARDRAVIIQYFGLHGSPKTLQEIAGQLGCTRQCVHHRLHRALRKLRKIWRKECY